MIKSFLEFNEAKKSGDIYPYGCVMIYPNVENWDETTSMISPNDVYKTAPRYGIETDPHVTLLYGLHPDVTKEDVKRVVNRFKKRKFNIKVDGIGKFDENKFSVVKLNIDSNILHQMNAELKKLPHTNKYQDYEPHMTIAYVKPGRADRYLSDNYKETFTSIDRVVYKMTDGSKAIFKL